MSVVEIEHANGANYSLIGAYTQVYVRAYSFCNISLLKLPIFVNTKL